MTSGCPAGGTDLDGDGDASDDVLQVYDTTTHTLYNTQDAVTPCRLPQCDPRLPYRVFDRSVKFLTVECDQHGPGDSVLPGRRHRERTTVTRTIS